MPAPAHASASSPSARSRPRASRGKARPKPRASAAAEEEEEAPRPPPSAALELPDFMHEDEDGDGDGERSGVDGQDAAAQAARYDASYTAFMDELDRDDDGGGASDASAEAGASASTAAGQQSLSVFSTSLLPNRSLAADADEDGEDDFDMFVPRRDAKQDPPADVRDAEDPAYAQRLADILGSDDGDEEDDEGPAPPMPGIVPSPSALEDARDAERVEAELSIDIRDDTAETGLGTASMEEDEDEDDEGFVYQPSAPAPQQENDDDDDEDDFVYRPSSASSSVAPQLPPIFLDSSTPPQPHVPLPALPLPAPAQESKPAALPPAHHPPARRKAHARIKSIVGEHPPVIPPMDVEPDLSFSMDDPPPTAVPAIAVPEPAAVAAAAAEPVPIAEEPLSNGPTRHDEPILPLQVVVEEEPAPTELDASAVLPDTEPATPRRPLASMKVRPKLLTPSTSFTNDPADRRPGGLSSRTSSVLPGAAPHSPSGSSLHLLPSSTTAPFFEALSLAPPALPAALPSAGGRTVMVPEREVLKLSAMRKAGAKLYASGASPAEAARGLGEPTVLASGQGLIAVGTSRGWTLVFALDQELRCVVGTEALAQQGGSVTALSFSLDSTFIGVGHASGNIALYDLTKPSLPARQVAPVSLRSVQAGRKEGHLPGCAIVQLEFVARRHTAIVSADAAGVAVYHALGKILGVSSNDTLRIFGQYPIAEAARAAAAADADAAPRESVQSSAASTAASDTASVNGVDAIRPRTLPTRAPSPRSILFGVQPLPLGSTPHLADAHQFVAILTPHKLVLVGLKPAPRTWWRKTAPRTGNAHASRPGGGRPPASLDRLDSWNSAVHAADEAGGSRGGSSGTVTPRRHVSEHEDFADGLEIGDEEYDSLGGGGRGLGTSPLRLVRGIPEGRTADDFAASVLPGDRATPGAGPNGSAGFHDLDAHDDLDQDESSGALCGALAWQPASELPLNGAARSNGSSTGGLLQLVHPVLAFSFGRDLFLLHLVKGRRQIRRATAEPNGIAAASSFFGRRGQAGDSPISHKSADGSVVYEDQLGLQEEMALVHRREITGLQWLSPDLLLILDAEGLNLFDLRVRRCTERQRLHGLRAVSQRWDSDCVFHAVRQGKAAKPLALTASHSFRIHEGRAILLGSKELLAGTALSWTDRIIALVSAGDFLSAIELAQAYYEGTAPGSVIGLPSDRAEQKRIVEPKLRDLMQASASYAFSPVRLTDNTHVTPDGRGVDRTPLFEGLARVCALACLALGDLDFLFNDLYELYAENGIEGIFVGQMEEFIVSGRMRTLPTDVVQRLVAFRKSTHDFALAERIIYHVDPLCLDLDQAIGLCLEERLYDALIYVYTEAMDDFVGPIVNFVEIIKKVLYPVAEADTASDAEPDEAFGAYTLFAYLSAGMIGLAYPLRKPYPAERAQRVKKELYGFVFAGTCTMWPQGAGGKLVQSLPDDESEPTYPYLRLFLHFDADALLEVVETAFEDSFLSDDDDDVDFELNARADGGPARKGDTPRLYTRQKIVDLLLDIVREEVGTNDLPQDEDSEQEPDEHTNLTSVSIFVARNAPKFPQFIKLSPAQVDFVFEALTHPHASADTLEERQLATEYLLSSYKVANGDRLLELLEKAGFWRLLQDALRRERRWDRLVEIYLDELRAELDAEDPTGERLGDDVDEVISERPIFGQLEQVLGRAIRERASWLDTLGPQITEATPTLLRADVIRTVAFFERFFPARHHEALDELTGNELAQLAYLRCFYDPAFTRGFATATVVNDEHAAKQTQARARVALELLSVGERLDPATRDRYIALLARHRPDDLVQAFDAQPWAEYVDLDNGGRFLFDKHFGAKALGRQVDTSLDGDARASDQEPMYREVKPFLDGMTSAYRLRIELLGMANRLFDRDLFGDLDRLAARRVRGWRPRAALTGSAGQASCGVCGEDLVSPLVGAVPTAAQPKFASAGGRITNGTGERTPRPRVSLRDRRRSSSMISLPPPRPPSSPFIEAAAGGPAKPDKGKGVSRGYFPPFEDLSSPSTLAANGGDALSPDDMTPGGSGKHLETARRIRGMSPHSHAQLRAMSMGGGGGTPRSASMTLSPALSLGAGTSSTFADMQASETQPVDLFAPDAAALGLPPDEAEEDDANGEEAAGDDLGYQGSATPRASWDLSRSSSQLSSLAASRSFEDGNRARRRQQQQLLGASFESGLGLLMEGTQRDETLVVFANGEVRHRRCCELP